MVFSKPAVLIADPNLSGSVKYVFWKENLTDPHKKRPASKQWGFIFTYKLGTFFSRIIFFVLISNNNVKLF